MVMIRSFLPVGQGAFYCESFREFFCDDRNINIVYDCGSSTNVELVERQIRHTFHEGEDIHAVFISHLHDDHINGLEYLLKYCNVKSIFFPLLTPEEKKYLSLYNIICGANSEGFTVQFINNPYVAVNRTEKETTLYQIAPSEEEDKYYDGESNIPVLKSGSDVMKKINIPTYAKDMFLDWCYIPFNFRYKERTDMLKNELKIILKNEYPDYHSLYSAWITGSDYMKNRIKQAYSNVSESFNTNSMVLFSGTKNKHILQQMAVPFLLGSHFFPNSRIKKAGCLYTGDYNASRKDSFDELYNKFESYWNYIGCLQIPHHGSKHNYNSYFSALDAYHIISAGKSNRYQHPHSYVIKDLLQNESYPYIVSEDSGSAIDIVVVKK